MDFKARRESRNLTQEALAKKMGVARSTVAMWEAGETLPRADKLPELARILKCSIDDLLSNHEDKDKETA